MNGHILEVKREEAKVIFKFEISGVIVELDKNQIATELPHSRAISEKLKLPVGDWIRLGMLVRIISRTWDDGIHYWKRSQIMDILHLMTLSSKLRASTPSIRLTDESVIPRPPSAVGDVVMVISPANKYKELHGRVTFLDQCIVTVQLLDDGTFISVQPDELCLLEADHEE